MAAASSLHPVPEVHEVDETLTVRQEQVLEVIRAWVTRFGYPPSVREIGAAVGLTSTSSVAHQLRALQRMGYLRRDANKPRAIGVLSDLPDETPFLNERLVEDVLHKVPSMSVADLRRVHAAVAAEITVRIGDAA